MTATLQWIGELNRTGMGACNDGRLEEAEAKLILALYLSKSREGIQLLSSEESSGKKSGCGCDGMCGKGGCVHLKRSIDIAQSA